MQPLFRFNAHRFCCEESSSPIILEIGYIFAQYYPEYRTARRMAYQRLFQIRNFLIKKSCLFAMMIYWRTFNRKPGPCFKILVKYKILQWKKHPWDS